MGVPVTLHEMRVATFAHRTGDFRGNGLFEFLPFRRRTQRRRPYWEMRGGGHHRHRRPPPAAGGRLAADRDPFAAAVTAALRSHPRIEVAEGEVTGLPAEGHWIIATGPLTSGALAEAIRAESGAESLAFFDAIAPIVHAETIDMSVALGAIALRQGRDRGRAPRLSQPAR